MSQKPTLSKTQLEALDLLITILENQEQSGSASEEFLCFVAKAADSFIHNVTSAVTDFAQGHIAKGFNHLAQTCPSVVSMGNQIAAATEGLVSGDDKNIKELAEKLEEAKTQKIGLTLQDLINLRNQYNS